MNQPSPQPSGSLRTPLLVGGGVAILGVVLFVIIYFAMEGAGAAPAARLFTALCVPPALIAVSIGLYILFARPTPRA
jgi:hypothetical protein